MMRERPLFAVLLHSMFTFFAAVVGILYAQYHGMAPLFNALAGAAIGLYVVYKKDAIPSIIIGSIFGIGVSRIIFFDESFFRTLIITIVVIVELFVQAFLFVYLADRFRLNKRRIIQFREVLLFLGISLMVGLIGSTLPALLYVIIYGSGDVFDMYFSNALGDFSGIVVLGSLTINSFYHDQRFTVKTKQFLYAFLYGAFFIISTFIIFNERVVLVQYETLILAFVILYTFSAFVFPFRMIIFNNMVILFVFNFLVLQTSFSSDLLGVEMQLTFYLVVLSIVSVLIRMIVLDLRNRNQELHKSNDLLEKIIISTNDLFNIQDRLPEDKIAFSKNYLVDMFSIACDIFPKFDSATCFVRGEKAVEFLGARGYDLNHINSLKFKPEEFTWSFYQPEVVYETNYQNVFPMEGNLVDFQTRYPKIVESIRFTIKLGEEWYGGMSFDIIEGSEKHFNEQDLENFTSFQNVVNSYFSVGTLNAQNNSLKDSIVLSLVRVLELYDSYTGSHSLEVADLSVEIAQDLRLPTEAIRQIYWAAIVHDIGMIGISDEILNKKTPLLDEEYEIIKRHANFGYNILNQSDGLKEIAKIVRHHHEKWNGTGYPDGLRSIGIPYASQIIQVCDAVSSMSSARIYKKPLSIAQIIDELQNELGKQFSPKVAKYMIKYLQDGRYQTFLQNHRRKGEA